MVPKMLSEEKQAITKKLYKDGNVPPEDVDEYGNRWPTKEALILLNQETLQPLKVGLCYVSTGVHQNLESHP